ncbi:MAG: cobalamin biosynthesis protein, partial [Fusobacteriaceae bacterium]
KEQIISAILEAMKKNNLSLKSIKLFATVDLKADEVGLLEAVADLDKTLRIISRDEIREIEDMFEGSEFVKSSIGVSSVSAPCAFLASGKTGILIEEKYVKDGVTLSIYEESFGNEKK